MSSSLAPFVRAPARRSGSATAAGAAAAIAGILAGAVASTPADAKTPGSQYCFYGTCHRVQSIAETERQVGAEQVLQASFYDDCKRDRYNPCGLTSSGEAFRPDAPDNAASPVFPDGTTLLLFNPRTKGAAVVRVNNAGPYWGKRKLDVSRAAAEKLGFRKSGVADLKVRVIKAPTKAEATYKKNRKYTRVPGYLGQYADAGAAHRGFATMLAMEAMAGSLLAPVAASSLLSQRAGYIGAVVPSAATAGDASGADANASKKRKSKPTPASVKPEAPTKARSKMAAIGLEGADRSPRGLPVMEEIRELAPLRGLPGPERKIADATPAAIWF